jgi:peptidoglycan/LPS O-acetylase OafA/YrhL
VKYRSEIDGLRAFAVVPVILFHAGFELFSGGFVGVDVFFVISGYLITTILINDIEKERFSIVDFYERRARRILPALFFVMLACVPFAWKWMLPSQIHDFSQSLIAVSLFASNILFWRKSGYFDAAAEEKPLLHTWSLAVEEQYYLLFPVFLVFAWRFGRERVFWMIVIMASLSLLLSEWGWRNNPTANFYLSPSRAWELFAGSIAAFVVKREGVKKNNALSLLGLAAIILSILLYDARTPFPSVYSLVPVIGVMLIVMYGTSDTLAARFLSAKAFVGIGLISYSAYLWHQPLLAFARLRLVQEPSMPLMGTLALSSLALGFISWRYVEQPFRKKEAGLISSRRFVFSSSLFGLFAFAGLGLGFQSGAISVKFSPEREKLWDNITAISDSRYEAIYPDVCHYTGLTGMQPAEFIENWNCYTGFPDSLGLKARVAVAGDSNAADVANAFRQNRTPVASMSGAGCSLVPSEMGMHCKSMFQHFINYLNADAHFDILVLTNLFTESEYDSNAIHEMIRFWTKFNGRILFLHDTPRFPNHYQALWQGQMPMIDLSYHDLVLGEETLKILKDNDIYTLGRNALFCEINECSYFSSNGDPLISDERGEHLSVVGASLFGEILNHHLATQVLDGQ